MEFNLVYKKQQFEEINHFINVVLRAKIDCVIGTLLVDGKVTSEPVPFDERDKGPLKPFVVGDRWGKLFDCAWFRLSGKIDPKLTDVYLRLDISGEACLFDKEGHAVKGFTNGSSVFERSHGEPGKRYCNIDPFIQQDGTIELWVEAGANDLFGNLQNHGRIMICDLVSRVEKIRTLYYDMEVLYSLLCVTPKTSQRHRDIYRTLRHIYLMALYDEPDWEERGLQETKRLLSVPSDNPMTVHALGHAHLDLAWLWPIRETRRKAGRTMATVLKLLDGNDTFLFGFSQPQLLEWIRCDYPDLFERISQYVDNGRIELLGGMWVESDTNIPGEESLVRQMLYGIDYYKRLFGKTVKTLWLPDVFGYSGCLPQIIKKSGLDSFMTIKLSWNLINQFPYHTFIWRGIDGSEVLTHMPPEGNYNSSVTPAVIARSAANYREKPVSSHALTLFGIGDGGGGPGEEHLERIKRQKSLDPLPRVIYNRSDTFFETLRKEQGPFPVWEGELYLENHQGTYTSQTEIKRMNRFLEQKLKAIETLLCVPENAAQIKPRLNAFWQEVLLYQFHDILPGTSIDRVYNECLKRYRVIEHGLDNLVRSIFPTYATETTVEKYRFNPLHYRTQWVEKQGNQIAKYDMLPLSSSKPVNVFNPTPAPACCVFETSALIIHFCERTGALKKLVDKKHQRNVLKNSGGNVLSVYKDFGDAWNIKDHYRNQTQKRLKLVNRQIKVCGHLTEITQTYRFLDSMVTETIILGDEPDAVTFHHDVDWRNSGWMLRTAFVLDIDSEMAYFDIQFGEMERTRHNHTEKDKAQFEVSAQQWVSVNDGQVGVSLINNAKYGFHVKNDILDMNLLRSTNHPAKKGDIGKTTYQYKLVVHPGDHHAAQIDRRAAVFNTCFPVFNTPQAAPFKYKIDQTNIAVSALKVSEDLTGTVLRLYETDGVATSAIVTVEGFSGSIYEITLNEDQAKEIDSTIDFGPFEIKTLKFVL